MPRIAIISTTFYPDPAVASVRMTQFCRFLPEFGWSPTVLCRHYGFEATADDFARDVHPDVSVRYLTSSPALPVSGSSSGLNTMQRFKGAIGRGPIGQLAVPDLSIRFWRSIRQTARRLIDDIQPQVILTTSPLHATHDLGRWLREETGLPWVADFRDPYRIDPRYQPRGLGLLRRKAHQRFEASIYRNADLILHNIPVEHRWARLAYPDARQRMRQMLNGCPPELAERTIRRPDHDGRSRFSVRVIGAAGDEESQCLVDAVAEKVRQGADLELRFVGHPPRHTDRFHRQLAGRVTLTGLVPHREALDQMAGADLLVCNTSTRRSRSLLLSSKLFEYLAVGVPVLVVNPTFSDRQFLRRRPGVWLLTTPDRRDLIDALDWAMSDDATPPRETVDAFRTRYNRRRQVQTLADDFNQLLRHSSDSGSK